MPVREIFADRISQECSACEDVHDVPKSDFVVGTKRDTQIDGRLMELPPCPVCGGVEFLVSSADAEPEHPSPGSYGHKHKLLVDKLNAEMVRAGRHLVELDPATLLTKEPPAAVMDQWFPGGLRLARPGVDPQGGAA